MLFQSLVGFKINWNCGDYPKGQFIFLFQSLVGFKINWNPNVRSLLLAV